MMEKSCVSKNRFCGIFCQTTLSVKPTTSFTVPARFESLSSNGRSNFYSRFTRFICPLFLHQMLSNRPRQLSHLSSPSSLSVFYAVSTFYRRRTDEVGRRLISKPTFTHHIYNVSANINSRTNIAQRVYW